MVFWFDKKKGKKDLLENQEEFSGKPQEEKEFCVEVPEKKTTPAPSLVKTQKVSPSEKLIKPGIGIAGRLSFDVPVRIAGNVEGELYSTSTVIVDERGTLAGSSDADSFEIFGKVSGRLSARSKITLHPASDVQASITTPNLEIKEGAVFNGKCI